MARDERWWRNDLEERGWNRGERDVRDLGQHRDYGRDMLNDMRQYARGDRDRWDQDDRRRDDWGRDDRRREGWGRGDFGRMGYDRSDYDYGRGGHYGGSQHSGDRGFLERAGDEMASWFGDEDAERRRRTDAWRGDSGAQHHRGRGPKGYTRSDERIREDINDRLTDDPYLDASDIEVTVSGAEVTLSGSVEDRRAKHRAEDIAESVSGARHVQNNLRVRQLMGGMMGSGAPDAALGSAAATTRTGSTTTSGTGRRDAYDTRTTGVVGDMNAPATLDTADTDSITRR
ncbi:BON domain-containing protein [Azospirillum rugosum]|uniref:Osmotically-inducible protein OsmY n=1 Tax=Azospirillum rugosum TaxID=416170 RepID=A0ABS4SXF5_9PROT|nr:BON domain-containing protein [Azospirillum rugosum]MBP2297162.1 osmotically-inducible protein OsmY [Azospirillum rugosum]MDQ0528457.1 osmotically-inducible protein OsmY [Azospirillum rugosum]